MKKGDTVWQIGVCCLTHSVNVAEESQPSLVLFVPQTLHTLRTFWCTTVCVGGKTSAQQEVCAHNLVSAAFCGFASEPCSWNLMLLSCPSHQEASAEIHVPCLQHQETEACGADASGLQCTLNIRCGNPECQDDMWLFFGADSKNSIIGFNVEVWCPCQWQMTRHHQYEIAIPFCYFLSVWISGKWITHRQEG